MVFYSIEADKDLDNIRKGLLTWKRFELEREFVFEYLSDLQKVCESIGTRMFHLSASYKEHQRYGKKVYRYQRNQHTTWYIIYDIDVHNNVYINKIISNHITIE